MADRLYCSVQDLRDEGVTVAQASDNRLTGLIAEATLEIDDHTGWWFDAQDRTFILHGDHSRVLDLPAPAISLTSVTIGDDDALDLDDVTILGPAPVRGGTYPDGPSLARDCRWPKRNGDAVTVVGKFGRTEHDGTATGRVPLAIRRACMLLVMRNVSQLADDDPARYAHRVTLQRTRTQEVDLREVRQAEAPFTGDPEIDAILLRYRRPIEIA